MFQRHSSESLHSFNSDRIKLVDLPDDVALGTGHARELHRSPGVAGGVFRRGMGVRRVFGRCSIAAQIIDRRAEEIGDLPLYVVQRFCSSKGSTTGSTTLSGIL